MRDDSKEGGEKLTIGEARKDSSSKGNNKESELMAMLEG